MNGATSYKRYVSQEQLLDGRAVRQRLNHLHQTNITTPILAEVSKSKLIVIGTFYKYMVPATHTETCTKLF